MPYKNKEDYNAYMREYRKKKKIEKGIIDKPDKPINRKPKKITKLSHLPKLTNEDIDTIKNAFIKATHQRSITRAEAKRMLESVIKLAIGDY